MKRDIITAVCFFILISATAQDQDVYNPAADPQADIEEAMLTAREDGKHILLMIGGNWCPWCRKLNKFITTNSEVSDMLDSHYELVKVNYSKENKNKETLAKYGFPQRFGFPVLVILDENGRRIHTQSTVCLEQDKGYNQKRVEEFLKNWRPEALAPSSYE
ncbi:MAG: thioredoxin family protein [Bacteroidales bacterium]|nr:thioredoxin family protein [Bacteroidales bacterium]